MNQNQSVQKMFQKYFIWCIIVPIALILSIALSVIFYLSQKEVESRMELVQKQIVESLELELYSSSMQMSHFLLINGNEFLNNLGEYFVKEGIEKYAAKDEMDEQYNQAMFLFSSLVGIQFYGSNGETYNYGLENDISRSVLMEELVYDKAKTYTDVISVAVLDAETYLADEELESEQVIALFMSPSKLDSYSYIDMTILIVTSNTFDSIVTASEWAEGVSIYLLNDQNEVMVKSDDLYVEGMEVDGSIVEIVSESADVEIVPVGNYGWKIATVSTNTQMSITYRLIIGFVFLGMLIIFLLSYFYMIQSLKNIITPINYIAHTMRKVKKKGVFEQVESNGPDEIRIIGETYNEMIQRIQELMDENIKKEREKQKEELLALEYQINPHFLSNTVNSIQFMAKVAQYTSIQKMAESMNKILELSFRNKARTQSLKDEIELLNAYIYIMEIRYANAFMVEFEIDEVCMEHKVPKLMLQPFIENSIVHGFVGKAEMGEIIIKITEMDGHIYFEIRDNGIGMNEQQIKTALDKEPQNGKNIAIANINKRLKLYYGEAYNIGFDSEEGSYTIVKFSIPIIDE